MDPAERRPTAVVTEKRLIVPSPSQIALSPRRALILTPKAMDHFEDLHACRLAEELRSLGLVVDVGNLNEPIDESCDWCILTGITHSLQNPELGEGAKDAHRNAELGQSASAAIQRLRPNCRAVSCSLLDCTHISLYEKIHRRRHNSGIDSILDVGFLDRRTSLTSSMQSYYHYIPNGLTFSEKESLNREPNEEDRPIPWMFVGHANPHRVALLNDLVTHVDPRGFVYMPNGKQDAAQTTPFFNRAQYETALRKSRYHIWYCRDQHFSLESERFRQSLLAGGVPIRVVSGDLQKPSSLPFGNLVLHASEAAERIRQFNYSEIRRRFRAEFLALPRLAEGLAKFLISRSLLPARQLPLGQSHAA